LYTWAVIFKKRKYRYPQSQNDGDRRCTCYSIGLIAGRPGRIQGACPVAVFLAAIFQVLMA